MTETINYPVRINSTTCSFKEEAVLSVVVTDASSITHVLTKNLIIEGNKAPITEGSLGNEHEMETYMNFQIKEFIDARTEDEEVVTG